MFSRKSVRLLMIGIRRSLQRGYNKICFLSLPGLDATGKTSILYQLALGEIVTTIPTIGKFD